MTATDKIFSGRLDEARQDILDNLRKTLAEHVEWVLHPYSTLTLEEAVEELNARAEQLKGIGGNEDQISAINEEIQALEDARAGFLFEETEEGNIERDAVNAVRAHARMSGGGELTYSEGAMYVEFTNKQAASDFADWLESDAESVYGYEIDLFNDSLIDGYDADGSYELDQIEDDSNFTFGFTIYLNPEIVQYAPYEVEVDDFEEINEENGSLMEVVRKVKINFRGKKRIKMKCRPGFKWDAGKKTCVKITGAQLAKMRKSLRRSVLTKRSKGTAYKARVLRKTRKAKRFRRMMGMRS